MRRLLLAAVVAGAALAGPAPDAGAVGVCTANVSFAYAPGFTVNVVPTAVTGTVVLNCPVLSPDAGTWTLPFAGPAFQGCLMGGGVMTWGAGTGPAGPTPAVGGFQYTHAHANSLVLLGTAPGGVRTFAAALEWIPVLLPGDCVNVPVTAAVATGAAALA